MGRPSAAAVPQCRAQCPTRARVRGRPSAGARAQLRSAARRTRGPARPRCLWAGAAAGRAGTAHPRLSRRRHRHRRPLDRTVRSQAVGAASQRSVDSGHARTLRRDVRGLPTCPAAAPLSSAAVARRSRAKEARGPGPGAFRAQTTQPRDRAVSGQIEGHWRSETPDCCSVLVGGFCCESPPAGSSVGCSRRHRAQSATGGEKVGPPPTVFARRRQPTGWHRQRQRPAMGMKRPVPKPQYREVCN